MINKILLCLMLALGSQTKILAQSEVVSNHSIGVNLLGLEYSYEQKLGGLFSLNSSVGLGSNLIYNYGSEIYMDIAPYISIAPRYYYNLNCRASKSLNTSNNSANYVTIGASYMFKPIAQNIDIDYNSRFAITPAWGIRRVYSQKWLLDFNIGLSFLFSSNTNNEFTLGPNVSIKFGYIFK